MIQMIENRGTNYDTLAAEIAYDDITKTRLPTQEDT